MSMIDTAQLSIPTTDELMERARERTGLSDFGSPTFRDGLGRFLESIGQEEAYFTQDGVTQLCAHFVDRLCNRLQIEKWYADHPETEDQQPEQPLLITGLPRTGTSAFANILSIEPAFRCLRAWEQARPVPPPTVEGEASDPRRLTMLRQLENMKKHQPEQMKIHLHELDATNEDVILLARECKAQTFTSPVFGYHRWWRDSDMGPAYAYQRRVVKLLQSRRPPNRWLFKAPHYVFHLDKVVDTYPDAKFVVTHRDPVKTLPSWASLLTSLFPTGTRARVPMAALGAHIAEHQAIGMRRMMEARSLLGADRFLDVHHHEFVADPIATLKRVYAFVDLPFRAETQQHMRAWSEANRPGAYGEHVYTAAQFGFDAHEIREQFAFYTDAFDVRLERI